MNLKDPALRIRKLKTMRYSADGETIGIAIERQDGEVFDVSFDLVETRRLLEHILLLTKEAAKAPKSKPTESKRWAGNPIDVEKASVLDASTPTHTVVALSFGRVSLGLRLPRLLLDSLIDLESPVARQRNTAKKRKPN